MISPTVNRLSIFYILIFGFIFTEQIFISDLEINAGESGVVELSVTNENTLGGFQFQIIDFPNQGYFENVVGTDRTSAFTVSFNEQADGSLIIVGFDLTGAGLSIGEGSILELTYVSTGIYTTEIELSLNATNTVLSDLSGTSLDFTYENSVITVSGEDPPPVVPVENLLATAAFGEISLTWIDPNDAIVDIVGYRIYRDGIYIADSNQTTYLDTGLQQVTEYCYIVTAYSATTESDQSSTACATTPDIYLEEPQNLTATENGLEVFLDWQTPPSAIGVGDDCDLENGSAGYLDCSGVCFATSLADTWIGDGFCDGTGADYGVNFSCSYWSCDVCDCAGLGQNSDECIEECGSFSNSGNTSVPSKEMAEGTYLYQRRDLIGYEVYRDGDLIDYVMETEYLDTNEGLWYLEESCYNVVADYDEGSSGFSNTACATPQLNSPSSL